MSELAWLPTRLCEGHLEGRHYQWPLIFCAVSIRSSEHSLLFPLICPPPPAVVDVVGHWLMRTAGVTVSQFSAMNPVAPGTRLVFHSRRYHSVFSTRLSIQECPSKGEPPIYCSPSASGHRLQARSRRDNNNCLEETVSAN